MSEKICKGCGGITNTVFCDYIEHREDYEPRNCYAKFENGYWIKGCAYDKADAFIRSNVNRTIISHALRKLAADFLKCSDPTIGKNWAVCRVIQVMRIFNVDIAPEFIDAIQDDDDDTALMWIGFPKIEEKS